MARSYKYRRSYAKRVYLRKRWATNMKEGFVGVTVPTTAAYAQQVVDLCTNSVEGNVPSPVLIKFGRLKLKGDVRYSNATAINFSTGTVYAVFVPQGQSPTYSIIQNHPEYLLGWTVISMDSGNSFSLTTTLKRNLNSGDRICLIFRAQTLNNPSAEITYAFYYNVQFWTTSA